MAIGSNFGNEEYMRQMAAMQRAMHHNPHGYGLQKPSTYNGVLLGEKPIEKPQDNKLLLLLEDLT